MLYSVIRSLAMTCSRVKEDFDRAVSKAVSEQLNYIEITLTNGSKIKRHIDHPSDTKVGIGRTPEGNEEVTLEYLSLDGKTTTVVGTWNCSDIKSIEAV